MRDEHGILAVTPGDGAERWRYVGSSMGREAAVAVGAGDRLYFADGDTLRATDTGACGSGVCEPVWSLALPHEIGPELLLAADDTVYAAVGDTVRAVRDGAELWSWGLSEHEPRRLALATGDRLYVASDDGRVFRLDALTGRHEWYTRYAEDDPPEWMHLGLPGVLYIGGADLVMVPTGLPDEIPETPWPEYAKDPANSGSAME